MKKISASIIFFLIFASLVGAVFIATWKIPAPMMEVEKILPDNRFPR
tara:strand:+ start:246 stop:386 length:141 start_codon:yes stop_codon:yes gene_type:complete